MPEQFANFTDMPHTSFKLLTLCSLLLSLSSVHQGQESSATLESLARPATPENIGNTPTWSEAVAGFKAAAAAHPDARMREFGTSDVGRPLHLFEFGPQDATVRVLINNAIHPGEPCGVNACLEVVNKLLSGATFSDATQSASEQASVLVGIIPMYNVGGGLRRGCCSRANQNGPAQYGFRGNARNLDLNRDFIKCDSRNALAFNRLFSTWQPDVFVDTHTSNGADYAATMTLIATQPDKLGGPLGTWLEGEQLPRLYSGMEAAGWPMTPYVNSIGAHPEEGIADFMDSPRYSTGFAALHHVVGFTTEAHMLKPFDDRVAATAAFLWLLLSDVSAHAKPLLKARAASIKTCHQSSDWPIAWAIDGDVVDSLYFGGYMAKKIWSPISGSAQTHYDRSAPFWDSIPYLHTARPERMASIPSAYIIPQAWRHVAERLRANGVELQPLERDSSLVVETYLIERHSALGRPYEGHHLRSADSISKAVVPVKLYAGDFIAWTSQPARRYLIETLEPRATDSFFAWNFFDACLQQKEYFSPYVFEQTAAELLSDPTLAADFERALEDSSLASSPYARLNWLYLRSNYAEGTAGRYPIFRIP